MGVVKYVNSKSELEIQNMDESDPKWYDQGFYYPNDIPVKAYYYRAIDGVMIPYGIGVFDNLATGITINNKVIGGVKTQINTYETLDIPESYDYNTFSLNVEGTVNVEGQVNVISLDCSTPVDAPETPSITIIVKDPHDIVQESVKIYKDSVLIGTTDVNGQAIISANESDSIELYKNGFLAKEYVVRSVVYQDVIMTYVLSIVNIGTQIWTNFNLDINDNQEGTKNPDNNPALVADLGLLYTIDGLNRINLLVPNFTKPSVIDRDTLSSYIVSGEDLKEEGFLYWLTGNNGNNSTGFNGRGAGFYSTASGFFLYKEQGSFQYGEDRYFFLRYNTDIFGDGAMGADPLGATTARLIKTTGDNFNFSISVNALGAALVGATVTVEGSDYITDANGQVHIEEHKTSVNYSIVKAGYTTVNGSIDLTTEFTKITTLIAI